jgi:hypothetical protein
VNNNPNPEKGMINDGSVIVSILPAIELMMNVSGAARKIDPVCLSYVGPTYLPITDDSSWELVDFHVAICRWG